MPHVSRSVEPNALMGELNNSAALSNSPTPENDECSRLNQYAEVVLSSREMYKSCHIETPDHPLAIAAITVNENFYSLLKVAKNETDAIEILERLEERGDRAAVTIIPKGYAIWVFEPSAMPLQRHHASNLESSHPENSSHSGVLLLSEDHPPQTSEVSHISYQILTSRRQYTVGKALIRGLDRPVPVVYFQQQCYSLFKTIQDIKQTAQVVKQISGRGKQVVITRKDQGYGIWVLENHAQIIE
ncbi:MAG: hypothetical protein VKL39_23030 [Leptolyngbyaceae bacterium]|nr:hypothetical protein [Leptolyngbyaceae bacterium]